jgi:hypothetical protein
MHMSRKSLCSLSRKTLVKLQSQLHNQMAIDYFLEINFNPELVTNIEELFTVICTHQAVQYAV